jgi:hypothetical protein
MMCEGPDKRYHTESRERMCEGPDKRYHTV